MKCISCKEQITKLREWKKAYTTRILEYNKTENILTITNDDIRPSREPEYCCTNCHQTITTNYLEAIKILRENDNNHTEVH